MEIPKEGIQILDKGPVEHRAQVVVKVLYHGAGRVGSFDKPVRFDSGDDSVMLPALLQLTDGTTYGIPEDLWNYLVDEKIIILETIQ